MKHLQTFESFVKNYGEKMSPEQFAELPVGSTVLFKGARHTVEENNDGATIVLKPVKGGSPVMVNLNQFIQGGAITESFKVELLEGYMSELDILRQESKTVEEFVKKAKQEFPEIKKMKEADVFLNDLWSLSNSMD
jgi:hypothetical protein